MLNRPALHGVTLVELLIALAIGAGLLAMAGPGFTRMIQNMQVRTVAESLQSGLQLARAEAIKRNVMVRFTLVTTLDNSCVASAAGRNWLVGLDANNNLCGVAPSDTVTPRTIQARPAAEGGSNVTIAGFRADLPSSGQSIAAFNGLGQLVFPTAGTGINFRVSNPNADFCKDQGGQLRCLQVNVSRSGQVRMCDPSLSGTDAEGC